MWNLTPSASLSLMDGEVMYIAMSNGLASLRGMKKGETILIDFLGTPYQDHKIYPGLVGFWPNMNDLSKPAEQIPIHIVNGMTAKEIQEAILENLKSSLPIEYISIIGLVTIYDMPSFKPKRKMLRIDFAKTCAFGILLPTCFSVKYKVENSGKDSGSCGECKHYSLMAEKCKHEMGRKTEQYSCQTNKFSRIES